MNGIDIKKAFAFAWGSFKINPAFYILGLLVAALAFSTLLAVVVAPLKVVSSMLGFISISVAHWLNYLALGIAFTMKCLFFAPLFVGFLKGIKKEAEGERASVADLFQGFQEYFSVVVFSAVMGAMFFVASAIGAAFLSFLSFVPSLLLCPVLSLGLYYLAEGCTGSFGMEAIVKAFRNWSLLLELLILVVLAAAALGGFALCCVGLIATVPLGIATVWHLCRQHDTGESPRASSSQDEIGTPS